MERYPFTPFESEKKPEKSGDKDTAKKKSKKSTRIPLPVSKPEDKNSSDKKTETPPEDALQELFASKEAKEAPEDDAKKESKLKEPGTKAEEPIEELPEKTTDDDSEVIDPLNDSEEAPPPTEAAETEITEDPEAQQAEVPDSLEGEFVDEAPLIITRGESSSEPAQEEATTETPAKEAQEEAAAIEQPNEPESEPETLNTEQEKTPMATESKPAREPETPDPTLYEIPEAVLNQRAAETDTEPEQHEPRTYAAPRDSVVAFRGGEAESSPPKQEADNYYARKRASNRGVLAGGIFGWWLGRRSGRREAASQAKTEINRKDEQISELESLRFRNDEQLRDLRRKRTEAVAKAQLQATGEKAVPFNASAERPAQTEKLPEKQPDKPEQAAPEHQTITEKTYRAPEGRRVETSAWHRYEVDRKTGQPVEASSIEYGDEFRKEQRQERLQRDAAQPQAAALVGKTIMHAGQAAPEERAQEQLVPPEESTASASKKKRDNTAEDVKQQLVRYTTSPAIWISAIALVVLLLALGLLT